MTVQNPTAGILPRIFAAVSPRGRSLGLVREAIPMMSMVKRGEMPVLPLRVREKAAFATVETTALSMVSLL